MKIRYKIGDLLDCPEQTILQGVNMQIKMRSGIAKAIREKYPEVYEEYKKVAETKGLHLGDVIWVATDDKLIANGVTQEFYGRDNKCYIDYEAIRTVMKTINSCAILSNITHVSMPLIGAGLGGGDFSIISKIIEEESKNFQPVVYVLTESDLP